MDTLTKHWQKMSLNVREGKELGLDDELSSKKFTMATKFLTRRALNIEAVTRTFSPLWRSVKGFEVRRSSDHVLLFTFEKKEEVERIMSNAPWSFNKHLVVLQWYDKEFPLKDLVFEDGGSFLRMKVTIDVNKPLCRGRLISLSHGEQTWVSFKYERLPNICY